MAVKKFKPRPGQVDFTHARWAPVVNCVVFHKGKILLVRRSRELNFYPGYWNGISGFLDDRRSLEEKVKDEIYEELGVPKRMVKDIKLGEIFDQEEARLKKIWIVHSVLAEVATDKVRLDWEAEDFKWVAFREAKELKLLPGFDRVLKSAEKLAKKQK